jgi:transcriptional regulator with XRE-family HTH domain
MAVKSILTNREEANKYFGQVLRENRLELGMTQEQVAFAIGVAPNTISRIERGKVTLLLKNAVRLAELYDITINVIFGEKGLPHEEEIMQMENTLVAYFTEDRLWMGIGRIESFNPRTYSFKIRNKILEPTEKDSEGNPLPWIEKAEELSDRDVLLSRKDLYIKRLSDQVGKEIFLYDKDFSIVLLGKIIRTEDSTAIVKIKYSKIVDESDI